MPNLVAYLALLLWPLVVVGLFRRCPPATALIWSVLGAYLALPPVANIDLPAIPPLDKFSIPVLAAWAALWGIKGVRVRLLPPDLPGRLLTLLYLLWPLVAVQYNSVPIPRAVFGEVPGLRTYDAISMISGHLFTVMLLAMARDLLSTPEARRSICLALGVGGLIYSLPMLLEVRISPQLNIWVYGFFPHDFAQMVRQGGYRPMVFLSHGLWVAFYAATAVMALATLGRVSDGAERTRFIMAAGWMMVALVLCKSLGSLIYTMAFVPLIWLLSARILLRIAVILGLVALAYPMLRGSPLFPEAWLVEMAGRVSPDRAQSVQFRLENETVLLNRAFEKAWTGWGGFGRNLLYDPVNGRVLTITDGRWIIVIGSLGWPGFLAEFGLLVLPLLRLRGRMQAAPLDLPLAGLALIAGVNMIDMLPNATSTPLTWLIVGALSGARPAPEDQEQVVLKDPFGLQRRTII